MCGGWCVVCTILYSHDVVVDSTQCKPYGIEQRVQYRGYECRKYLSVCGVEENAHLKRNIVINIHVCLFIYYLLFISFSYVQYK